MGTSNSYKPTVSALILDEGNKVLLTHNKAHGPNFWKMPQGGVEVGESEEKALMREMKEELGTDKFTIIKKSDIDYRYNWPPEVQEKKGFVGPMLIFFILRCDNVASLSLNQELDQIKWVELDNLPTFFKSLPEFQQTVEKLAKEVKELR